MVNLSPVLPKIPAQELMQLATEQQAAESASLATLIGNKGILGSIKVAPENQEYYNNFINKYDGVVQQYVEDLKSNPQNAVKSARELQLIGLKLQDEVKNGALGKMNNAYIQYQNAYQDAKKSGKYDPSLLNTIFNSQYIKDQFSMLNDDPNAVVNVVPSLVEKPDLLKKASDLASKIKQTHKDKLPNAERVRRILYAGLANDKDMRSYDNMMNSYAKDSNYVRTADDKYMSKSKPGTVTEDKEDAMTIMDYEKYNAINTAIDMYTSEGYGGLGSSTGIDGDGKSRLDSSHMLNDPDGKPFDYFKASDELEVQARSLVNSYNGAIKAGDITGAERIKSKLDQAVVDWNNMKGMRDTIENEALMQMDPEKVSAIAKVDENGNLVLKSNEELNNEEIKSRVAKTTVGKAFSTIAALTHPYAMTSGRLDGTNSSIYKEFINKRDKISEKMQKEQSKYIVSMNKTLSKDILEGPLFSTEGLTARNSNGDILKSGDINLDRKTARVLMMSPTKDGSLMLRVQDKNDTYDITASKDKALTIAGMIDEDKHGVGASDVAYDIKTNRGGLINNYINLIHSPYEKSKESYGNEVTIPVKNAQFGVVKSKYGTYIIKTIRVNGQVFNVHKEISQAVKDNDKKALANELIKLGNTSPEELIEAARVMQAEVN